jgi:hypothetical protein
MKKILLAMLIVFVSTAFLAKAETGMEVLNACASAMKVEKLDSFKTISIKAYLYQQGQKVSIKYFSKDYGKNDDMETKVRLEQSAMGQESALIITEDEIFQVVPEYEVIDRDDAAMLFQIIEWLFPTDIRRVVRDTTGKVVFKLEEEITKFNSKNCKKIGVASSEKPEEIKQHLYLDEATNWLQGVDISTEKGTISLVLDGFKKIKGFVYPTTIKLLNEGKKLLEVEIDKFEANIELEDSLFEKAK